MVCFQVYRLKINVVMVKLKAETYLLKCYCIYS